MNDDFSYEWTRKFDTADLIEGLSIACQAYAGWDAECIRMRTEGGIWHLRHFAGSKYLRVEGFPPEPRMSFNGSIITISTMADYALAVDRPAPLPMRFVMARTFHAEDDETASPTVADVAECLRDAVIGLRDMNAQPVLPRTGTSSYPISKEEFTGLGLVMFASVATTLEAQARFLSETIPTTTGGRDAMRIFADHLKTMAAEVPMPPTAGP